MKKENRAGKLIILCIIALAILNIYFFAQIDFLKEHIRFLQSTEVGYKKEILNDSVCPNAIGGSDEAILQMKYFYTNYCPWCKKEEPILNKILDSHGSLFYLEWYDLTKCQEIADKYDVSGVPTFVFGKKGEETTYTKYGFIPEEDLKKFICDVYGGCIEDNKTITLK